MNKMITVMDCIKAYRLKNNIEKCSSAEEIAGFYITNEGANAYPKWKSDTNAAKTREWRNDVESLLFNHYCLTEVTNYF